MKREGVPACGPIGESWWCRLKEKIDYLWDRASACILTVNHQTPDGDGDFAIAGGTGITVTDEDNGIRIEATITEETVEGIVGQEAAARQQADQALQSAIDAEEQTRISADNTLRSDINTRATQTALDAEEAARQQADQALQADVDSRIPRSLPSSIVQDVTVAQTPTAVTLTLDRVDPDTGAGADQIRSLPVASASQAGVMSSAQVTQLQQASGDIEMLKGQSARYTVRLSTETPTQQQIQAAYDAITPAPPSPPKDGTTLLDLTYDKEYTWFSTSSQWVDRGQTVVSLATQASPGIVQGADADGKIYVEGDGTMSVKGWDAVKDGIANNASAIGTEASARQSGDAQLQQQISAEASARQSADTTLGSRVTAIEDKIGSIPDIEYTGPFFTSAENRTGPSGEAMIYFGGVKLDGTKNTHVFRLPRSTETADGVIKLGEVVVKNQGTENAGKALVVGSDGMVAPGDVGGGGEITTFSFDSSASFNTFKEWIRATGSYKQFSGILGGNNGNRELQITVGGKGSRLYGGGLLRISIPMTSTAYYPISICDFEVVDENNITITVTYLLADGSYETEEVNMDSMLGSASGAAFVIN